MSSDNDADRYRPLTGDEIGEKTSHAANDNWELAGPCPADTTPPSFKWKNLGNRDPDELWPFHDAEGRILGYELRWDLPEGKQIRFAAWCKNVRTRKCEWRMRGLATPRPPFNLQKLAQQQTAPVIVFEGCRKADRVATLFPEHICTAFPNGAGGVGKCDLRPLQGRTVIIWRDADEPGEAFAYELGHALKAHCPEIQEVDVDAVYRACSGAEEAPPQGWDVVDALASSTEHDTLRRIALKSLRKLELNVERPDGRSFIKVGPATLTPDGGLWVVVKKGSAANPVFEDVWVSGPFEVLGRSRDKSGVDWGVFIGWKDADGREHTHCVPNSEIYGDPKKLATKLTAEGFPLCHGRERLLAQFLTMAKPKSRVTEVATTGWHDVAGEQVFVLPDETFGHVRGEVVRMKTTASASNYAQAGTLDDWQRGVGTLVKGHRLLVCAVSAAFTGPLLQLTHTDGGGLHNFGESSSGKTTTLRAAASVWGRGHAQGFIRTWHATSNGLEAAAALATDTMLALDELGSADADEVSDAIYQLSNGGGKSRAQRSGDAQKPKEWRVMFLSSGELPIESKLAQASTKRAMAGQLARMVDIEADAGKGFGVFDSCGRFETPGALANAITAAASRAYGTAGPAFIRLVMAVGPDRIAARVCRGFIDPFVRSLGAEPSGQVMRVAQRFALIAAAGELAVEWGICPWDKGEAYRAAEWAFQKWIERRGGTSVAAEERQGVERFRLFFQTYGDSRFEPLDICGYEGERVVRLHPHQRAGFYEGNGADRCWYLFKESFAAVCGDLDPRMVARALDGAGALITQPSGGPTVVKRIHGKTHRVYALRASALGETTDEPEAVAA